MMPGGGAGEDIGYGDYVIERSGARISPNQDIQFFVTSRRIARLQEQQGVVAGRTGFGEEKLCGLVDAFYPHANAVASGDINRQPRVRIGCRMTDPEVT